MELSLIELVMYLIIGAIKLVRYITLHVAIPHVVDYVIFDPIINWVKDNLIGTGTVAGDDDGTGDVNGV